VRDDSGAYEGATISANYDPLISKLCVWAPDRARAVARMRRALSEYVVSGIRTNLGFHARLFEHPEFVRGHYDTSFIDRHRDELLIGGSPLGSEERLSLAAAVALATYRAEHNRPRPNGNGSGGGKLSGLSPWVASHRARLGGGRRP
jgi:acetyl-CoA carboxylase biotin carboxylase subunit